MCIAHLYEIILGIYLSALLKKITASRYVCTIPEIVHMFKNVQVKIKFRKKDSNFGLLEFFPKGIHFPGPDKMFCLARIHKLLYNICIIYPCHNAASDKFLDLLNLTRKNPLIYCMYSIKEVITAVRFIEFF